MRELAVLNGRKANVLAIVDDYGGLVQAIADRRKALELSQLAVDELTGLTTTYQSKIESQIRRLGPLSLPLVLATLGLKLAVIEDDEFPMRRRVEKARGAITKRSAELSKAEQRRRSRERLCA